MVIECYDIGATNLRCAVVTSNPPKILHSIRYTPVYGSKEGLVEKIKCISNGIGKLFDIDATVIGVPGPVENGILLMAPHLALYQPVDFSEELGYDVMVENDLNLAVLAELKWGHGKSLNSFYLFSISTGLGAGIVINGTPLTGSSGEVGHNILETNQDKANLCGCKHLGCWGAMASGLGIESSYQKINKHGLKAKEVFDLYYKGEPAAVELMKNVKRYNAHGLGHMINFLQVDTIIVMGSVALNHFDAVIPSVDKISEYTINNVPPIIKTELGDDIGLLGAYALATDQSLW
jgi:glucokinase